MNDEINRILAKWNPIEVSKNIVETEYLSYVEPIIKIGPDYALLRTYFINLLTNTMGLSYDDSNDKHRLDLEHVIRDILVQYNR